VIQFKGSLFMNSAPIENRSKSRYSPYTLLLRFILSAIFILFLSRVLLVAFYWERVGWDFLAPLLLGGLRIDLCLIAMISVAPAVLTSLFSNSNAWRKCEKYFYRASLLAITFFELITPTFIYQYDTRPNRLFYEYLQHPQEVTNMLFKGFGSVVAMVLVGISICTYLVSIIIPQAPPDSLKPVKKILGATLCVLIGFGFIRGTMAHRPINPSTVAFASDRMVNTLPLNSTYSLLYSLYRMKDEKNAGTLYGSMPDAEMHNLVLSESGISYPGMDVDRPSLHLSQVKVFQERAPNVVIILEESLGARYVGHLEGANLTPELDLLAEEAWTFTNLHATGTRSARGIEAVITGFLPTPARSVLKLGMAQSNFFTLANLFDANAYDTTFMYGGEGHFDNMKAFLLNNGFKRIIDRSQFRNPIFTGSWGVSDEDMFNRLHEELTEAKNPKFIFAFTVTNHTPYEYPEGRIVSDGNNPATVENAVRYVDWAIGDFFRKAKKSDYYKNTIFLIVSDHDSRVYGASLIPTQHFHIPGLILGENIKARRDSRLLSQIDLGPTLVSLAGISAVHPMLGRDLTRTADNWPGRAIMQYGENYGYQEGEQLIVLQPKLLPTQYLVSKDRKLTETKVDPVLRDKALAHALWPSWAYRNRRYPPYI
jgi:phosphoglycerol transferase MdoB-like AlkP superfamily enzyme